MHARTLTSAWLAALPCLLLPAAALAQTPGTPAQPAASASAPKAGETPPPAATEQPAQLPPPATAAAAPVSPGSPQPAVAPPPSQSAAIGWFPPQPGPATELQPEDEPTGPTRDMSRDFWQVNVGIRSSWIGNEGYDPFSKNDNLTQFSVSGTRALLMMGSLSLAAGVLYEVGTKEAQARGATANLTAHRLGGIGELRLHFGRDVYSFARLVPQAVYTRATLRDGSLDAELQQKAWRFGADGTLGAAWNIPRTLGARSTVPEFWLTGEFGYGFTTKKDLEMKPDVDDSDPASRILVNMGSLSLNGIMMRVSAAVTF